MKSYCMYFHGFGVVSSEYTLFKIRHSTASCYGAKAYLHCYSSRAVTHQVNAIRFRNLSRQEAPTVRQTFYTKK